MREYEYKSVPVSSVTDIAGRANKEAGDGWRLISITIDPSSHNQYGRVLVLEREIESCGPETYKRSPEPKIVPLPLRARE